MRIAALCAILMLSACGPSVHDSIDMDAEPPADAPPPARSDENAAALVPEATGQAQFRKPFRLIGTEPFWSIDISGPTLTLSRPEPPAAIVTGAVQTATDEKSVWTGRTGENDVMLTVTAGECSDGMSDLKYPYEAVVVWGGERLRGCAAPMDALPRESQ